MNTENWKWFYLIDYFDMYAGTYYPSDSYEKGNTPLVSASNTTNGIMDWTNLEPKFPAFCITIGKVGMTSFVQPYPFCASPDVTVLIAKSKLNIYQLMFVKTILDKERFRWNYGNQIRLNDSQKVKVKFPVIKNLRGEIVPDWQWMEDYAKNTLLPQLPEKSRQVWEKRYNNQPLSSQKLELKVEDWKWFRIGDLFYVELSRGDLKPNECIIGEIPLISSGDTNNGVVMNIRDGDGIAEIFDSNVLTVDMFCKSYYQPKCFYAVSHGRVNILKPKFPNFNQYIAMFIATLIDNERFKFSYGRAVYSNVIDRLAIKLPATTNENSETVPDWQWMEDYIKGLPYSGAI